MIRTTVPPVACVGEPRLTAGFAEFGRLDLMAHEEVHGPIGPMEPANLLRLAEAIDLKGKGGAGFPFARKLRAVLESCERQELAAAVVVNATEGEPASWKDKVLLTRAPHLLLDGAALAAYALDAEEIVIGVADDDVGRPSLTEALQERRMPVPTTIVTVPHRFISGEAGALVNGINGLPHIPPGTKKRSSDSGVGGLPTLLSNAETYAQLAVAARLGPYEYAALGTDDEPGTVLLTVTGAAGRPAVVECAAGTPLRDILDLCEVPDGPGILMGGYHGKWISPEAADRAEISRKGLAAVGGTLGAGIVVPLGRDTCPLGEAAQVVRYLAGESAGQCGPCKMGLPDLARAVDLAVSGSAPVEIVRAAAGDVKGRGACSHPDGTARFALSAMEVFADDLRLHTTGEGCGKRVKGVMGLPGRPDPDPQKLTLDWSRCDGHGLCAHVVPDFIRLDTNGYPAFPSTPVPTWLREGALKAVKVCPELALRLAKAE
ncbi:NADH-quinone oxidoreductase subunit I [Micromonospora globispora]|uniref:NADH-quinone oxidoreductase subunit I n=1 Tax=Micromonospora globispora TaxID=1450148 RepID=A0A317JSE3_9ACTN|nr:NADH-quinone oxidoreductase subunit NuoF family protein [Micromonospora globispora]PWU43736.1 NADH-quinone oxidoreductase subunit I [Micromonospora globispora]PWU56216.1 NADH-quinone oxidoreductase subunit I [Micromonospora globispora]RQW82077.1 NADH-quinone oxidoreductase subunit I [Micromonospora globispora]